MRMPNGMPNKQFKCEPEDEMIRVSVALHSGLTAITAITVALNFLIETIKNV